MSEQAFHRLAPFIQEHIYTQGWTELRQVQMEACQVVFETDAHLLIAAGTASGKTEAAFLPVLTLLYEQPAATIAALYIGPIKALINDQFDRLSHLLKQAEIPVWAWHGDVAQRQKSKLLKHPQGILQITPESLESLLINQSSELGRLFGELRFVVIDEIHAFMGTERGGQILCQLTRLANLTQNQPRRIGLSATLGDYTLAEDWLRSGTTRSVCTPTIQSGQRTVHFALEHFYLRDRPLVHAQGEPPRIEPYDQYLFNLSHAKKCLIFANSRPQAESTIAHLRQIASLNGLPDIYHVHHGSIAAPLREAAEAAMRHPSTPAVTAATLTFELGIDIGQLERVIQLEAPLSVASFLQRLGRSGRRGGAADMRFVCAETQPTGDEILPEQLPWQLLQCIAIIQLYVEERWIEPTRPVQYPLSLLYHQTMSTLVALGELSPAALAQKVLTLPPFSNISTDDFRQLLHHLLEIDHVQRTETGNLLVGLAGERIVGNFKFYATFPDSEEYAVKAETAEIGSIVLPPPPGQRFALAGRTWEVMDVDSKTRVVWVKSVEGDAKISWYGSGGMIHTKVLERMRQVLLEETQYPYLQRGAQARLQAARQLAGSAGLAQSNLLLLDDKTCCIFPWMGTIAFRTLERFLHSFCKEALHLKRITSTSPYFLTVQLGKAQLEQLYYELVSVCERRVTLEDLLDAEVAPELQKYDEFIPTNLLHRAFGRDHLDLAELKQIVSRWPSLAPAGTLGDGWIQPKAK